MNRQYKDKYLQDAKLPVRIGCFHEVIETKSNYFVVEYDGLLFEGTTERAVFNKVLRYIFSGGEHV